jgi:hypothetical protein
MEKRIRNTAKTSITTALIAAAVFLTQFPSMGIGALAYDPSEQQPHTPAWQKPAILDLEDALGRAELVVAVRLVEMTEAKIVYGGKTEVVTQQFRFEPVRTLKGIFARDALLLTGQDLGLSQFGDAADRLERGQMLLLLLGRQGPGYFNCNTAESLDQSIPHLRNQDDPLIAAVEALIRVTQQRDRAAKTSTLLTAIRKAEERDAVPLLISLRRRALFAAQDAETAELVSRFLKSASPDVRQVTARTLAAILEADYLKASKLRENAVVALVAALDTAGPHLELRAAALDALSAAGEAALKSEPARAWLRADRKTSTFAEQAAIVRAIGRIGRTDQGESIATMLDGLPLDAPPDVQVAAGRSLIALDPGAASSLLTKRLETKSDAGLDITVELNQFSELPRELAVPALLAAFRRIQGHDAMLAYATSCARVADARLVPTLGVLLDPRLPDVRWQATEALRKIDTDEAASVLWPYLSQETDLLRKLQLAEFLGRHGFRGGYPYAIEHMSAPPLQDAAVDALAAIQEPKAVPELRKIWEGSNDPHWNAAAIRALGRLGQADIAPKLLELAADRRNSLAAPSLIALADLGETKALPIVLESLSSRNDQVVGAAIRAARTLLSRPGAESDDVRDKLAALLVDTDASQVLRMSAFDALAALNDPRLDRALQTAARDGSLEGSDLMRRIEQQMAGRRIAIPRGENTAR